MIPTGNQRSSKAKALNKAFPLMPTPLNPLDDSPKHSQ